MASKLFYTIVSKKCKKIACEIHITPYQALEIAPFNTFTK